MPVVSQPQLTSSCGLSLERSSLTPIASQGVAIHWQSALNRTSVSRGKLIASATAVTSSGVLVCAQCVEEVQHNCHFKSMSYSTC